MTASIQHLFVGPVDLRDPTLLLSGDRESLLWLAHQIESRCMQGLQQGHPAFVFSPITLALIPSSDGGRLDELDGLYEWRIGEGQVAEFVARLRALAAFDSPGHEIVASKGEYDLKDLMSGALEEGGAP